MGALAVVIRKGRKRQTGNREPNGRLQREVRTDREMAALQPHRRTVPVEHRLDPMAESILGRLVLRGKITRIQNDAAEKYAADVRRYKASICSIDHTMKPAPGFGEELTFEDCRKRKVAYDDAFEAACSVGQKAAKAVAHAINGVFPHSVDDLSLGLSALVSHYRLTNGRKSDSVGNRS
jgi:hypothetical protein